MANGQNANPNGNGYSYGWNKLFRRIVKTYCAVENASVGEFNSSPTDITDLTSVKLNLAYPDMTVMGKVVYTNINGQAGVVKVMTRITAGPAGIWAMNELDKV